MVIYVDDMYKYPLGQFRGMKMSHMIADTHEELHTFAAKIGMKRQWFQGDHYDIAMSTREKAVKLGAVEISMRELASMCRVHQLTGKMPKPEDAIAAMLKLFDERKKKKP